MFKKKYAIVFGLFFTIHLAWLNPTRKGKNDMFKNLVPASSNLTYAVSDVVLLD